MNRKLGVSRARGKLQNPFPLKIPKTRALIISNPRMKLRLATPVKFMNLEKNLILEKEIGNDREIVAYSKWKPF